MDRTSFAEDGDRSAYTDPESIIKAIQLLTETLGWEFIRTSLEMYRERDAQSLMSVECEDRTAQFLRGRISAFTAVINDPDKLVRQANVEMDKALENTSRKNLKERMRVERGL